MRDFRWAFSRLKSMKPQEMWWRAKQKQIQNYERRLYYSVNLSVTKIPLPSILTTLHVDIQKLSVNWENSRWTVFSTLDLFGVFNYNDYKNKWNAGFQTDSTWPERPFSPTINISQRVDIGDIRTNWELNRHYQFAALAKNYYCTKDRKYLLELKELFFDWNRHNLFLHGVEWTSAMEIAIRVNSWVYTLAFLEKAGCEENIISELEHGILVMTDYIMRHRARFSSANNHLIVEMYSVALVGILTDYTPWRNEALKILTEEIQKQNYSDGVNKEMSLHYQSFVIETYGLLWLLMKKNQIEVSVVWKSYLTAMTEFLADSTDDFGRTMEFGDSDEGKLLDLNGEVENHYQYVLNLMSCLLDKSYTESTWHENLEWIIPETLRKRKEKYTPGLICSRKEGGYTFLRSKERRMFVGIDHADLGYGSIAAHGHADALSLQLFFEGQPILVDSGTYNYHFTPEDRDYFRSTEAHNTVLVDSKEQSEMLGPFIWGKRSKSELLEVDNRALHAITCYESVKHRRMLSITAKSLEIVDVIGDKVGVAFFHVSPKCKLQLGYDDSVIITSEDIEVLMRFKNGHPTVIKSNYSKKYNSKIINDCISVTFKNRLDTSLIWE